MKKIVSYLKKEKGMTHIANWYTIKGARFVGGCYEFYIAKNGGTFEYWSYAPLCHSLSTFLDNGKAHGNYFPAHIKLTRALWAKAFGTGANEYDNN